ncbi:hypothetical protein BLL52_4086 [Rhodoferax antarcticus ANT.BR]|uniref:Uncharacterized protein n=1 Tax=Rhodoferax antarcticus ANT.BR TaxID=1111071 RepID=A0A1Q8Y958_9BURK|nr:hypothetical protein BLL52_4086 [Rhodoferax antarcticus ANT.BR]
MCFALDDRVIKVDIHTAKTSVYADCNAVGLHYIVERHQWPVATQ